MKYLLFSSVMALLGSNVSADYFDLARTQKAQRRAQERAISATEQTVWQMKFDYTLMGLGTRFASKHRGFKTAVQPASNSQSTSANGPNRALILGSARYQFATNDGNECILSDEYFEDDNTGPNGYLRPALHCISSVTGIHTDKTVRVR